MPKKTANKELRRGWTTGAYALATSIAAFRAITTGKFSSHIKINLPKGQCPEFFLSRKEIGLNWARAGAIKDAGDDPDVTHGAEVISKVQIGSKNTGIVFKAGEGVGTVTLPGLPLSIGEPAINPAPRKMITKAIQGEAKELGVTPDVIITISIPGGEKLAEKTMNRRLGILGGLSVLGTTGIVIPYSCASWINSIHRGVDVAHAAGLTHIYAATGATSESAIRSMFGCREQSLIDMGDFIGGLLKYLKKKPMENLIIAGGFSKLVKLSQGNLDLHSSRSQLNLQKLADSVRGAGGDPFLVQAVEEANSGLEALGLCQKRQINIGNLIAKQAREVALAALSGDTRVAVIVFDRNGCLVGASDEL